LISSVICLDAGRIFLHQLMSDIFRRPGFDCTCACTEYCAVKSMKNCWVSRVCSHAWNSRAALGCGAAAKMPVGPEMVGVPSAG